ncbi:thiamine phosphate synthase [Ornithinimicrobium tianjinense]|uniref:Thiamine-phosphate synthase n=1 Tax=Ornithinimicrobium tianjinense TaxID=1195761 RepID=A0A917BK76_9MICO|nr:thiamine phosphate synthase [Ornithinimicrobium tianjinense]GGF46110.1 thiamine-phosphate synthase [Ornithinimicrobium tianjinense]
MLDLRLYLVTDTGMTRRHGLDATLRAAVRGGVTVVQLRDHDASDREFVALGRLALAALRGTGVPLILNDRVRLVEEVGAQGAHVGQSDLDPVRAREMLGHTAYLGLSCHTQDQVTAACALPTGTVDYLGLGPVWATSTKADHAAPLGPDGLASLARASTLPAVAIGGVDASRLASVRAPGVAGVAVVSAVCRAEDPALAARELRAGWGASVEVGG